MSSPGIELAWLAPRNGPELLAPSIYPNRDSLGYNTIQYNTIQFINARRATRKGNYYNLIIHFPKYVLISLKPMRSPF